VDDAATREIRTIRATGQEHVVLLVTRVDDAGLLAAVEAGVSGVVRRSQATPGQLASAIGAAAALVGQRGRPMAVEIATVEFLVRRGVPVCAHIGLTPQHVNVFGGYRVQGREAGAAERLLDAARRLQDAGAAMMVIEAVPEPLARRVAESVELISIGIGASVACSGQVLVLHDLLGAGIGRRPRFVKNFLQGATSLEAAVGAYVADVQAGRFPGPEHVYAERSGN
jgi:3-methyl-2-oxobutanoate hydroxymethyltransferase